MNNQEITRQIYKVADDILEHIEEFTCHPDIAIAALAFAMCSLARAEGTSISDIEDVVSIANDAVRTIAIH
jgi:hypothetical protein